MKNDVYSEDINIVERFYWNMHQSAVLCPYYDLFLENFGSTVLGLNLKKKFRYVNDLEN